jgi:hypothetical protein
MSPADITNGLFEFGGAWFIYGHIRKLLADKLVRGVYWPATAFFAAWGWWNVYYYPSLGQWFSFAGGLAIVTSQHDLDRDAHSLHPAREAAPERGRTRSMALGPRLYRAFTAHKGVAA